MLRLTVVQEAPVSIEIDTPRPLSFKIVPGGYVYRAPALWLFSKPRHYRVSGQQKQEIEALLPQTASNPARWVWGWLIGAVIGVAALLAAISWIVPDHRFTGAVVVFSTILAGAVVALHLWSKAKLKALEPILAKATPTDEQISLAEIRQGLVKPQTHRQIRRAGILQGLMAIAFTAATLILALMYRPPGNFFSDATAFMFVFYALIMAMSSASSFRTALITKKEAEGVLSMSEEQGVQYLKYLTTLFAIAAVVFGLVFVFNGIRSEFSDFAQGQRHAASGDQTSAIASFTKVLAADPTNYAALRARAESYTDRNEFVAAIADYTQAIELNPANAPLHRRRGSAFKSTGANEKAIADYTKAIELDPTDRYTFVSRGRAYAAAGNSERAMADANLAVATDPKHDGAYHFRGGLHAAKKDTEAAIADYTKAIEINPKAIYSYLSRALVYLAAKDYDRAIADSSKSIELNPQYDVGYAVRGSVRQLTGEHALAIADYSKAIDINPKSISRYHSRASLYVATGERDLALADYRKVLDLPAMSARDRQEQETARKAIERSNASPGVPQVTAPPASPK